MGWFMIFFKFFLYRDFQIYKKRMGGWEVRGRAIVRV